MPTYGIRGILSSVTEYLRRSAPASPDISIVELLASIGLAAHEMEAREVLTRAGLTRPGKALMSAAKHNRACDALKAAFILSCGDEACNVALRNARSGARVLIANGGACERCHGSDNTRAARAFVEACRLSAVRRVVIVGGSPGTRSELTALLQREIDLRLVDGRARVTRQQAVTDLEWADLVLVWGPTQLDHSVSTLYTGPSINGKKVVTVARRGVAALVDGGRKHLALLAAPVKDSRPPLRDMHARASGRNTRH